MAIDVKEKSKLDFYLTIGILLMSVIVSGTVVSDTDKLTNVRDDDWIGAGTGAMYTAYEDDKVGIGTRFPDAPLTVMGGIRSYAEVDDPQPYASNNDKEHPKWIQMLHGEHHGVLAWCFGRLDFRTVPNWYTSAGTKMTITPEGNVGIGTINPDDGILEVQGEISTGDDGIRWKVLRGTFSVPPYPRQINIPHGFKYPSQIITISGTFYDAKQQNGVVIGSEHAYHTENYVTFDIMYDEKNVIVKPQYIQNLPATYQYKLLIMYEDYLDTDPELRE